jgi:oxygen-independent coproporphyrinogen-3 oxidase
VYWRQDPYEGVGPGAHAFDGAVRRWNAARLEGYLVALRPPGGRSPALPPGGQERLDPETLARERAILSLRLREGLDPTVASRPEVVAALEWAAMHGLLEGAVSSESGAPPGSGASSGFGASSVERARLSLRGRLLANEVFARIV